MRSLSTLEQAVLDADEIAAGVRLVLDEDPSLTVEEGLRCIENEDGVVYRWRCIVCGYIHEAAEPPRWCPLCGADRDQFVNEPGLGS